MINEIQFNNIVSYKIQESNTLKNLKNAPLLDTCNFLILYYFLNIKLTYYYLYVE